IFDAGVTTGTGAVHFNAGTFISFTADGHIDAADDTTSVTLTAKSGDFTMVDGAYIDGADAPITISATGKVALTLLTTTGHVKVTSSGDSISDADVATDDNDIVANNVELSAILGSIGSASNALEIDAASIGAVKAAAKSGVYLVQTEGALKVD